MLGISYAPFIKDWSSASVAQPGIGELLDIGWKSKRKFVKGVTNEWVDKLYNLGIECGALGGKLTGAGGGGHILFYCEPSKQKNLIEKMKGQGLKQLKSKFYESGCKVLDLYDFINS